MLSKNLCSNASQTTRVTMEADIIADDEVLEEAAIQNSRGTVPDFPRRQLTPQGLLCSFFHTRDNFTDRNNYSADGPNGFTFSPKSDCIQ